MDKHNHFISGSEVLSSDPSATEDLTTRILMNSYKCKAFMRNGGEAVAEGQCSTGIPMVNLHMHAFFGLCSHWLIDEVDIPGDFHYQPPSHGVPSEGFFRNPSKTITLSEFTYHYSLPTYFLRGKHNKAHSTQI